MTWKYALSSTLGTSHIFSNTGCQDASRVHVLQLSSGESVLIASASDGAGSASHSEIGSKLITKLSVQCVKRWLENEPELNSITPSTIELWVNAIKKRLSVRAEKLGLEGPRQLAGTFLLAIVGERKAIFSQIGDGAIVVSKDDNYKCIFWPQNGEYQNATYFLTDDNSLDSLEVSILDESIEEIALFTDGIQMLALDYLENRPHKPFFDPIFNSLRQARMEEPDALNIHMKAFLDSERVNQKTDDDKTLIIATRAACPLPKVTVYAGQD